MNSSASAPAGERVKCSVSPNPTAWKREARSWKLSGRLRRIRKKRLILQGLNRVSSVGLASVFDSAERAMIRVGCRWDGAKPWTGRKCLMAMSTNSGLRRKRKSLDGNILSSSDGQLLVVE